MTAEEEFAELEQLASNFVSGVRGKYKHVNVFVLIGRSDNGQLRADFNFPPKVLRRVLLESANHVPENYKDAPEPS